MSPKVSPNLCYGGGATDKLKAAANKTGSGATSCANSFMARVFIEHKLGFGSIFKRVKGDTVLANLYIRFKGKEYPVGSPRVKDAERLLYKLRGDFLHEERQRQKGAKRVVLVSELFDDLLSDYREKQRATLQDAGGYINNHLAPVFANMRCVDVATPDVKAYVRQRLKEGAKNATIK